ncbi:hypothetical protein, conserved [Eimeria brunetti]|uniref:Uncharacterized protein n=1 Tax=Eimeria brunetti TaxID=51314 RepID=U6LMP0_9EIME|nr:hypothetical protein, conserved [Eimeria brunetti]
MTAEEAAGGIRVDPDELKKLENVLPTFTRPDGSGILRLLSACDGKFSFVYQGPLEHRFGVKEWASTTLTQTTGRAAIRVSFLTRKSPSTGSSFAGASLGCINTRRGSPSLVALGGPPNPFLDFYAAAAAAAAAADLAAAAAAAADLAAAAAGLAAAVAAAVAAPAGTSEGHCSSSKQRWQQQQRLQQQGLQQQQFV